VKEFRGAENGLPGGWRMAELAEIADCRLGKMLDQQKNLGELRPYLRNTNVQWGRIDLDDIKEMRIEDEEREKYAVLPGDLLVCEGGEPGRSAVWREDREMYLQKALHRVRPRHGVSPEYIRWWLRHATVRGELDDLFTGSTIKHLPGRQLARIPIPIPPAEEQRRIADRLEEFESRRASVAARLSGARTTLERLSEGILAAACSGRLTADWREEHEDSAFDLVRELRDATKARRKPVATPDLGWLDEVPDTWAAVTLDLLIDRIEAGKSVRAAGRAADEQEWGVIKVSAMSWGTFRPNENKAIEDRSLINPRFEVRPGDLLLSRANTVDLVGATVLVRETRPRLLLSDKSLRLVPRAGVDRAWLNIVLQSPLSRAQFSERATGTSESMRNLSQPKILATTLALPSPSEQREIVRRVDRLFTMADQLSGMTNRAVAVVDRLSASVLAKAFRGELVAAETGRADGLEARPGAPARG
jgi:type I restriction enzyme S subunit